MHFTFYCSISGNLAHKKTFRKNMDFRRHFSIIYRFCPIYFCFFIFKSKIEHFWNWEIYFQFTSKPRLYLLCNSKTIKMYQNLQVDFFRFFYRGFFKNSERPRTSFQARFLIYFVFYILAIRIIYIDREYCTGVIYMATVVFYRHCVILLFQYFQYFKEFFDHNFSFVKWNNNDGFRQGVVRTGD